MVDDSKGRAREGLVFPGGGQRSNKKKANAKQMTSWREVEAVQRPTASSELAERASLSPASRLEGGLGQALAERGRGTFAPLAGFGLVAGELTAAQQR